MEELTKLEAIQAMAKGKKVRHRYFSPTEWMGLYAINHYYFEDGVICTIAEFWRDRTGEEWNTGWFIV